MTIMPPHNVDDPIYRDPTQLDPEESMSRDQIQALQLERLQWTLRHAYEHVELYRKKFDAAGVHPDDLKELSDLAKFPCTEKQELRDAYPFGAFAVPMDQVRRLHAAAGSGGGLAVVGYTHEDLHTWGSLVARCLRLSGVRPGDILHNAYGYGLFTAGLGVHYGAERLHCTVIPMSGGHPDKQIQMIQDFKPRVILCTPTYLLALMDAMVRRGINTRTTSLEVAAVGAEPWTEEMRREIEHTLGVTACDMYGVTEVLGPGVAGESCETKDGNVIWEDHFLPEIIEPNSPGHVVPDGESGELLMTSLTKVAMPVIRFRTHDLTRLLPGTARPGHRRMERISGRSDDMINLGGHTLFPTQIEEIALGLPQLSPFFQLEITRPDRTDELTVHIERRVDVTAEEGNRAAAELVRQLRVRLGLTCEVDVVESGSLPRTKGKLARINDLRG